MKIQVTVDDVTSDVEIEFDSITLQESVTIEEALGVDAYDRFLVDSESGNAFGRPSYIRALVFAKLRSEFPDIAVNDFDVDMTTVFDEAEADDAGNDGGDK